MYIGAFARRYALRKPFALQVQIVGMNNCQRPLCVQLMEKMAH